MKKKTNKPKLNSQNHDITSGDSVLHQKSEANSSSRSQSVPNIPVVTPPTMDVIQRRPNKSAARSPEHAKTLMRSAVSKPLTGSRSRIKAQSPKFNDLVAPSIVVSPKLGVQTVDGMKLAHAGKTPKNHLVHRFANIKPSTYQPDIVTPQRPAVYRAPEQPVSEQPSQSIFERAMEKSTSHEEVYVKPKPERLHFSKRLRAVTGLTIIAIAMGGILIYQNMNGINLYIASSTAGFNAGIPSYHPSGYSLGKVTASSGSVAAKYTSTSNGQVYILSEKPSDWDSTTLVDSYLTGVAGHNYQTLNSDGNTIFLYGNNSATWVSGGIWYQLTSNGFLTPEQITQIADSV